MTNQAAGSRQARPNEVDIAMPPSAMVLASITFFMFALMDTSAKYLVSVGFAAIFVVWCRFTSQGVILVFVLKAWKNPKVWKMQRPLFQIARGISLPVTTLFNFKALQYLQLAETMAVFLAAPMVVAALAGPLLGEWAGPRRLAAIFVGFVGVVIIVRPGTDLFDPAILYSIAATLVYALYSILTKILSQTETEESLIFYSCFFGMFMLLPFVFLYGAMPQTPVQGFLMIFMGAAGMVGHACLVKASKLSAASKVIPFIYTQVIWMVGLGYLVFRDVPDVWTLVGTLIIVASGLYLMQRERQLARAETARSQS